jgi:hypothetical protein
LTSAVTTLSPTDLYNYSGLRGHLRDPGYYLTNKVPPTSAALCRYHRQVEQIGDKAGAKAKSNDQLERVLIGKATKKKYRVTPNREKARPPGNRKQRAAA